MVKKRSSLFAGICIAALLAGCGGGGSSTSLPSASSGGSAPAVNLSIGGNTTILGALRQGKSLDGTPVTILVNGATVATGTLDANGKASIKLPTSIPAGTTITVQVGSHAFTATLSSNNATTDVAVTVNNDGSATVKMNADNDSSVDASTETEDQDGNPVSVDNGSQATLPLNLPILVSLSCTSISVGPAPNAQISRLVFEEKTADSDDGAHFKYDGSLTGPLTFAIDGLSPRIHVLVYDANGKLIFEMKAPIGVFTPPTAAGATPTPLCSMRPHPIEPGRPTDDPTGFPSWHPTMSPSPNASVSPHASSSPEVKHSPSPSPTPRATATATATAEATSSPTSSPV